MMSLPMKACSALSNIGAISPGVVGGGDVVDDDVASEGVDVCRRTMRHLRCAIAGLISSTGLGLFGISTPSLLQRSENLASVRRSSLCAETIADSMGLFAVGLF